MSYHTDPPYRKGYALKGEYEAEYLTLVRDGGCACHLSPPCSFCTSEFHPRALEETDEAWEHELLAAVRAAVTNSPTQPDCPEPTNSGEGET